MPDPSPQTDEIHVIREVHLNYSQDQPVRAPLTDKDAAAQLREINRATG